MAELTEGFFVDQEAANKMLIDTLQTIITHYQEQPAEGPFDFGYIARAMRLLACRCECEPTEDCNHQPLEYFDHGMYGDVVGAGFFEALGCTENEGLEEIAKQLKKESVANDAHFEAVDARLKALVAAKVEQGECPFEFLASTLKD